MSFMDNFTNVAYGRVEFNIDDGLDQDLVNYCCNICKERCGTSFAIEDGPYDCDCEVSRLYYAMVKLAEWENRGMSFEEFCKITPKEKPPNG